MSVLSVLCCRFHGGKYPAGRGRLANTVIQQSRGCCCNGKADPEDDAWQEGWFSKLYYSVFDLILDLWSAFAVMSKYVFTPETVLAICSSVASVILYDRYGSHLAVSISWTLISFAVVFPLTMSITQAFVRRDDALKALAAIRGLLQNILLAHMKWNWVGGAKEYNGRKKPTTVSEVPGAEHRIDEAHGHDALALATSFVDAMRAYLLVPRKGRARQVYTVCGQEEARWVNWAEEVGAERVTLLIGRFHTATETLKSCGLPPNEASRINQYLFFLTREWENIRYLKEYRTPQAMRSFSRVVVHTMHLFYGPYFVNLSRGSDGDEHNVAYACVYAALMSLFMCGLLLVQTSLENPFDTKSLDTVKVDMEMARTQRLLNTLFTDQSAPWQSPPPPYTYDSPDDMTLAYMAPKFASEPV